MKNNDQSEYLRASVKKFNMIIIQLNSILWFLKRLKNKFDYE